jgi:MFS family permease
MSERGGDIPADPGTEAAANPEGDGPTLAGPPAACEATSGAPDARHISLRTSPVYASGNFGAGFYYALNSFILCVLLLSLQVEPIFNNLLTSTRSVEGAVVQPIVGAWSDRTWKPPLGWQRFFIALFAPISALFVALPPFAPRVAGLGAIVGLSTGQAAILLVTTTVVLFTVTFTVMYDPYNALLADMMPESQHGHVNCIFQAVSAMGQVVILITAVILSHHGPLDVRPIFITVIAVALALLVFFIPTVVGIREPREIPGRITHCQYTVRDYWHALREDGQVQLYFANQFLLWFGISAIQFNLIYYARLHLGLDDRGALILSVVLLLTSALPVWLLGVLGVLGDRIGLKRVLSVSSS